MSALRANKWVVYFLIVLSSIACAMNQFKIPPVITDLMTKLNIDLVLCGWIMSIYGLTIMILIVPGALLINKIGLKNGSLIALGVTCLASFGGAFSTSVALTIILRIFEGVGQALMFVIAPVVITKIFKENERGVPMGVWTCCIPIAVMIIFNVATPIKNAFGLGAIWITCSIILAICFVLFVLLFDNNVGHSKDVEDAQAVGAEPEKNVFSLSAWANLGIMLCCLILGGSGFRDLAYTTWSSKYFLDVHGISDVMSNFYTSIDYLGLAIGTIGIGALIDRKKSLRKILITTQILTLIISFYGFALGKDVILPYMFALGLLTGSTVNCVYSGMARLARNGSEVAMGAAMMTLFCSLGQFFGAPLGGYFIQNYGWYAGTYATLIGSALMMVCAIVLYNVRNSVERSGDLVA
jgi:predicted MFS family arabinose efflux permease